jgi:hypothetical protein
VPSRQLLVFFALCIAIAPHGRSTAQDAEAGAVTTTLYARTDSNSTTVWSPRTRVSARASEDLTVEASYALDAWTSASVDIVTAATRAVHEVRHEINAGTAYSLGDAVVRASYRYSFEPDYWSHGAVVGSSFDLAQRNTTLDVALFGALDTVGRAGDRSFRRDQQSFGARLSLTQVLDAQTLVQLAWELTEVLGFQASPYRFVAVGGGGTCASLAPSCLPEHVPDQRTRQALLLRARRALGEHFSAGLDYRFYFDSWDVRSQTLAPVLSWRPVEAATVSLTYRYYTQGHADFYRARYLDPTFKAGYLTRDRELSTFSSHQLGVSYAHELTFERHKLALSLAARAAGTYLQYLAFVGLRDVLALELTGLLGVRLD